MHGWLRAALMAAALFCSSAPVFADVIYTYQGAPLIIMNGPQQPNDGLQIRLDFSDDGTTLLDWWSYIAGVGTVQKGDNVYPVETGNPWIQLSTDASGQVETWEFFVRTGWGAPEPDWWYQFIYSDRYEANGQFHTYEDIGRSTSRDIYGYEQAFYAFGDVPGVWSYSSALPDLAFSTVTPEPASAGLMVLGLLFVGGALRSGLRRRAGIAGRVRRA